MIPDKVMTAGDALAGNARSTMGAVGAASDFESFLTLLTAQLRHQDPLSPLDSTQFVAQLASFSSVEQQIETNKLLEALNAKISGAGLEEAAQWIGKEVEIASGQAQFRGEPLEFKVTAAPPGATAEIVFTGQSGNAVYREIVPVGQEAFSWNGASSDGGVVPHGEYTITVNYREGDELVASAPPIAVSQVEEARLVEGQVRLVLASGAVIDTGEIIAIRQSPDAGGI